MHFCIVFFGGKTVTEIEFQRNDLYILKYFRFLFFGLFGSVI